MNDEKTVKVGIAVVEKAGRYLVGTRPATAELPGKSEFPGGKCEPGESQKNSAIRECREETGLEVNPISLLLERRYEYAHATVELEFWLCQLADKQDVPQNGFRWVSISELETEQFPAANDEILQLIYTQAPFLKGDR